MSLSGLLFSSKHRISGTPSNFIVNVNNFVDQMRNIEGSRARLTKYLIKGELYNVNDYNNALEISYTVVNTPPTPNDEYDYTIFVNKGNYDIITLAQQLQTQIRTATGVNAITVTASLTTGKLTFATNSNNLIAINYTPSYPMINKVIGFKNANYLASTSLTSEYAVDLSYPSEIHIRSSLAAGSVYWDQKDLPTDILAIIYPDETSFVNINNDNVVRPITVTNVVPVASLDIRLTDSNNEEIELGDNGVVSGFIEFF